METKLNFEILNINTDDTIQNVFIPGFTANLDAFKAIANQLESNSILVDNLGAGKSPQPKENYSTGQMADQIIDLIDATTNNPINIIGHSMGGAIAQKIALKRPDLTKTLFLMSSFAKADQICIRFLQSREMLVKAGLNKEMIANSVIPSIFANDFLSVPENIDIIIERFRNNTQTPAGLSGQLRAIEDHNTAENLKDIKTQTKIITGKNDVLVSPEHSFLLHRHISNSLIFEIENCGHMVQMEKPDELLSILTAEQIT